MKLNIYNVSTTALVCFASETVHFLLLYIISSMVEAMHVFWLGAMFLKAILRHSSFHIVFMHLDCAPVYIMLYYITKRM